MSQVIISHTVVHSIPMGRRIVEIMKDKGMAYTQNAVSQRVGINRETLRLMLNGQRDIFRYELDKLANDLKIPLDRILQEDIQEEIKELHNILSVCSNFNRALEIANSSIRLAIGITERCKAYYTQARIYYEMKNYHLSQKALLNAYEDAEVIYERYKEDDLLYEILSRIMITSSMIKDFTRLSGIIDKVEAKFESSPSKLGSIYFSKAMIAEHMGNFEEARANLTRSLSNYRMSGKKIDVGRALLNLGYFEFKVKKYKESKQLLTQAIDMLNGDPFRFVGIKELSKTLIKLEEYEEARELIENTLEELTDPMLRGKLLLLLAIAKNDPSHAESILSMPNIDKKVLRLSCMYLLKHFTDTRDANALLKYSIIAEESSINNSDVIEEEDL